MKSPQVSGCEGSDATMVAPIFFLKIFLIYMLIEEAAFLWLGKTILKSMLPLFFYQKAIFGI
jgi:hypothetical protein